MEVTLEFGCGGSAISCAVKGDRCAIRAPSLLRETSTRVRMECRDSQSWRSVVSEFKGSWGAKLVFSVGCPESSSPS